MQDVSPTRDAVASPLLAPVEELHLALVDAANERAALTHCGRDASETIIDQRGHCLPCSDAIMFVSNPARVEMTIHLSRWPACKDCPYKRTPPNGTLAQNRVAWLMLEMRRELRVYSRIRPMPGDPFPRFFAGIDRPGQSNG